MDQSMKQYHRQRAEAASAARKKLKAETKKLIKLLREAPKPNKRTATMDTEREWQNTFFWVEQACRQLERLKVPGVRKS